MSGGIEIELGWPAKALSPNARVHHMALWRAKQAAKEEAYWSTKYVLPLDWKHDGSRLNLTIIAHPVKGKAAPDDDNLTASFKAYRDGIAKALGVDDKLFDQQPIVWADPIPNGRVIVRIG